MRISLSPVPDMSAFFGSTAGTETRGYRYNNYT